MKSDVIRVTNTGVGMEAALQTASDSAIYRGLAKKDALHLRLLAEEMLGMVRAITGETEADFWVESTGKRFTLNLLVYPLVTKKMRRELLAASSSGKNTAAVGFMGKLRDIFDRTLAAEEFADPSYYYLQGLVVPPDVGIDPASYAAMAGMMNWSMSQYKATVAEESAHNAAAKVEWDELEKSVVAKIADEVEISIAGDEVKMTVYKEFHH